MHSLFELLPYLESYRVTFSIIAALALITLVQNFLTAPLSFVKEEQIPGMPLRFDHSKLSFRAIRTYQNSAEMLPAFLAAALTAIIAGSSPTLVNIVSGVYLVARIFFWVVYYSGAGKIAGGPRTMAFVVSLLANIVLACAAIYSLF